MTTTSNIIKGLELPKALNLAGKKFHRLLAIKVTKKNGLRAWKCLCDCGEKVIVITSSLRNGNTKSCGCWHHDAMVDFNFKHGKTGTPEYRAWINMRRRCYDTNQPYYKYYGGRGIRVCKRWRNSFENFLSDMGRMPKRGYTLERKKVNKGYGPKNCVWDTQANQTRNKRNSRKITFRGKTQTLSEWARELDIGRKTLSFRLNKGLSIDEAFRKVGMRL